MYLQLALKRKTATVEYSVRVDIVGKLRRRVIMSHREIPPPWARDFVQPSQPSNPTHLEPPPPWARADVVTEDPVLRETFGPTNPVERLKWLKRKNEEASRSIAADIIRKNKPR